MLTIDEREHRSGCPINLATEVLGDNWSFVVLRDLMFADKRHFRELLRSDEGIASNILTVRLQRLVENGVLTRADDASHARKVRYSLTESGIQLVPVMVSLGDWGRRYLPASPELAIRAEVLQKGGPRMWERLMAELRELHLGVPRPDGTGSVLDELNAAAAAYV